MLVVSAVFGVAAIASAVIGILRREPPKRIREKSCGAALIAVIALRSAIPNSFLGLSVYFGAMIALVTVALWKGAGRA
jgi:hypothetical protein